MKRWVSDEWVPKPNGTGYVKYNQSCLNERMGPEAKRYGFRKVLSIVLNERMGPEAEMHEKSKQFPVAIFLSNILWTIFRSNIHLEAAIWGLKVIFIVISTRKQRCAPYDVERFTFLQYNAESLLYSFAHLERDPEP